MGSGGLRSQAERVVGVRESFPDALVLSGDFDIASGYELTGGLLGHGTRATAIVCGNDMLAVGAIQRLTHAGVRVPDDISVTGFDDVDAATVISPSLTTVRSDIVRIGRESARLLIDALEGTADDDAPSQVVLPVTLVVRESTGPVAGDRAAGAAPTSASSSGTSRSARSARHEGRYS